jgi:hypothetical protein
MSELTIISDADMTASEMISAARARASNCLYNGMAYEAQISNRLKLLWCKQQPIHVGQTAGSRGTCDIPIQIGNIKSGIEAKNLGAFEGGSKKLKPTPAGMQILEDSIHKAIIGNRLLYSGAILPWNENRRSAEDWAAVEHIFKPDIYIEAPRQSIADYYKLKGADYIQVEGFGLYHTGTDVFEFGVPKFECNATLRIRSTKHIKNGIPTDITAGLQFDRKSLVKSPYCLDTKLPPVLFPMSQTLPVHPMHPMPTVVGE